MTAFLTLLSTLLPLALAAGTYAFPGLAQRQNPPSSPSSPSSTVIPMANGDCTESIMPISITANNTRLKVDSPENQQALTDFVISWTSDVANFTRSISGETFVNNKTYNINTLLCIPKTQDEKGTVEFVVHGGGFDHTYWTIGGPGSKYNYVDAALGAGHAVLVYDRLGTGKSDKPNGLQEAQSGTNVEVAVQLIKYLQGNPQGHSFKRFVGVGHSYGSFTLTGVANRYGNLLNATVLTGYVGDRRFLVGGLATWSLTIAALDNPDRFGSQGSEYVVWNNKINYQQNFYKYPNYEQSVLEETDKNKYPIGLGELLGVGFPADSDLYTNPLFVVTGDKDYAACGGNCLQETNGKNLVEGTKDVFPGVTDFDFYIPEMAGHALTAHLNTPEIYAKIQEWFAQLA